jgi:hypothetical protein
VKEFNAKFSVKAAQQGTAFVATRRKDLEEIFSLKQERVVNQDNTVHLDNRVFQIEKTRWRNTLAGMTVEVHEHLEGSVSIHYGPHRIAEFAPGQIPPPAPRRRRRPRLPYPKAA